MKDLKTSLDNFNSTIEKLNLLINSINNKNNINDKNVNKILLKENENLKNKYADTLNKLEKILLKIDTLEKGKKNAWSKYNYK